MPGFDPHMDGLFWGHCDFTDKYDPDNVYAKERSKPPLKKFYGDLIKQKAPLPTYMNFWSCSICIDNIHRSDF